MRIAVIIFPGSNRDRDMLAALTRLTGHPPQRVWHDETCLPDKLDLIILPGGFSYGDYLRVGAIAALSPIMTAVRQAAKAGVRILGVCNGFQILCEAGLLPGALIRNSCLRYICTQIYLRLERTDTGFTRAYSKTDPVIRIPIAHHDGNYSCDTAMLARLEGEGQIAMRYCHADGSLSARANPNGSQAHIAGVYDTRFRILGLMPHPENAVERLQGGTDGRRLFESLIQECAA